MFFFLVGNPEQKTFIATVSGGVDLRCLLCLPIFVSPLSQRVLVEDLTYNHMSNDCLGYIGDYTTQLHRDFFINQDIRIPSLTNQYFMESKAVFFSWLIRSQAFFGGGRGGDFLLQKEGLPCYMTDPMGLVTLKNQPFM